MLTPAGLTITFLLVFVVFLAGLLCRESKAVEHNGKLRDKEKARADGLAKRLEIAKEASEIDEEITVRLDEAFLCTRGKLRGTRILADELVRDLRTAISRLEIQRTINIELSEDAEKKGEAIRVLGGEFEQEFERASALSEALEKKKGEVEKQLVKLVEQGADLEKKNRELDRLNKVLRDRTQELAKQEGTAREARKAEVETAAQIRRLCDRVLPVGRLSMGEFQQEAGK